MQVFHKSIKVIVTSVYPVEEQRKIMKDAADYYDKAQGVDILLEKIKKVERSMMPLGTILIIEDELKIRKLFRNQLRILDTVLLRLKTESQDSNYLLKNQKLD